LGTGCSYAVVMATDSFDFNTSYIYTYDFWNRNGSVPIVLDWSVGNETCEVARANMSTYACVSYNSMCNNSSNGPGYFCNCSTGYQGNPYLVGGCEDKIISQNIKKKQSVHFYVHLTLLIVLSAYCFI
jgi:hypothetical protein